MSAHPTAFTLATLAAARRDLDRVRSDLEILEHATVLHVLTGDARASLSAATERLDAAIAQLGGET